MTRANAVLAPADAQIEDRLREVRLEERLMMLRAMIQGTREDMEALLAELDRLEARTRKPAGSETVMVRKAAG